MRSTLCIPDQSCLSGGAFPADLKPDVVSICIEVFTQTMVFIKSHTDGEFKKVNTRIGLRVMCENLHMKWEDLYFRVTYPL